MESCAELCVGGKKERQTVCDSSQQTESQLCGDPQQHGIGASLDREALRLCMFTYTAREAAEAGLMFYRARYYQPAVGRFINEDPISEQRLLLVRSYSRAMRTVVTPDSTDWSDPIRLYSYVVNNPINWKDPSGMEHVQEPGFTKPFTPENIGPMVPTLWRAGFKCFTLCSTLGFTDDVVLGGPILLSKRIRQWVIKYKVGQCLTVVALLYCVEDCWIPYPKETYNLPFLE